MLPNYFDLQYINCVSLSFDFNSKIFVCIFFTIFLSLSWPWIIVTTTTCGKGYLSILLPSLRNVCCVLLSKTHFICNTFKEMPTGKYPSNKKVRIVYQTLLRLFITPWTRSFRRRRRSMFSTSRRLDKFLIRLLFMIFHAHKYFAKYAIHINLS